MADVKEQTMGYWYGPYNSGGGPFIVGYSDFNKLDWIIVKIYQDDGQEGHGWHDLPKHLLEKIQVVTPGEYLDEQSGALKSNLLARGKLVNREIVPPIDIMVKVTDEGKVTKDVDWPATLALWAGGKPAMQAGQLASPAGEAVYRRPWDEEDEGLAQLIAQETIKLGEITTSAANSITIQPDGELPDRPEEYIEVWKAVWYRITKQFDASRGAHPPLVPASAIQTPGEEAARAILDGNPDDFGKCVAEAHPLIVDEDHAKSIFQQLGIKASKNWATSPKERLAVARQIWLYATLRMPVFDVSVPKSADIAIRSFDEIPF